MISVEIVAECFGQHLTDFGRYFIGYILTSDYDFS